MATDLSNREGQLLDYMKEVMKHQFPEADLRNDGEFMEMFALPHVKLFEPLLTFIDRMRLMQSLENANNMTTEEMDEVARSHYTIRNMGKKSNGVITLIFEDVPSSGNMVIPVGLEATSKNDLRFRSVETVTLNEVTLAAYYDTSSFTYRIPVLFSAMYPGEEYNVNAGEITELSRGNLPNILEVINETKFVDGTNVETNVQLADRIRLESFAPNLGIERGYIRYINTFEDAKESLIAGYGHPLMRRDIIGEVEVEGIKFHDSIRELHWGTKVDVYVRGETPTITTEHIKVQEDDEGNKFVQLKEVPVLDIIDVRLYSLDAEYDDPDIDQSSLYIMNYALVKEEEFETEGTIFENSRVVLNDERVEEGGYVQVNYRYNKLISDIHTAMYEEDNRPPTADVKIKESNKKFVYGSLIVGMESSLGLRDSDRGAIRQQLSSWLGELRMGEELQFSDLLEPISRDNPNSADGIVDYVHLPFQFFVTENQSRYIFFCLSETKRDLFKRFEKENDFLHRIFEKYKDVVTTYDFFDIMHSFTHENGFDSAIKDIQFKTGNWGSMANTFIQLRRMALTSRATKLLSPPKREIAENEYFAFGETYVYESKEYDQNDWEKMLLLFWNIAKQGEEGDSPKEMYYLAVYILSVMYIATTEGEVDAEGLYEFVRKMIVSTPIEFENDI